MEMFGNLGDLRGAEATWTSSKTASSSLDPASPPPPPPPGPIIDYHAALLIEPLRPPPGLFDSFEFCYSRGCVL